MPFTLPRGLDPAVFAVTVSPANAVTLEPTSDVPVTFRTWPADGVIDVYVEGRYQVFGRDTPLTDDEVVAVCEDIADTLPEGVAFTFNDEVFPFFGMSLTASVGSDVFAPLQPGGAITIAARAIVDYLLRDPFPVLTED